MRGSFTVADRHEVEFQWGLFGSETYTVDGNEVLKLWSLSPRGRRKITVGEGEDQHDVEIEVDAVPNAKSWVIPGRWVARAYVDGELAVEDLTPGSPRSNSMAIAIAGVIVIFIATFVLTLLFG